MDTLSRGEPPPDADAAAGEAASRQRRGGVTKAARPAPPQSLGSPPGGEPFRLAFRIPVAYPAPAFLGRADHPGAVHKLHELVRADQPHQQRGEMGRAGKITGPSLPKPGLHQSNFGAAVRNNFYFVIFTVPLQTIFALWLAVLVNNKFLRGRSFFRTAFYFPSITSSIAITTIFIFLFQGDRRGQHGPGLVRHQGAELALRRTGHLLVVPQYLRGERPTRRGRSTWSSGFRSGTGFRGPSLGMCFIIILAVFTTSGTFMLFFLAAWRA